MSQMVGPGSRKKAKLMAGEADCAQNNTISSVEQVFQNDLLRENIIKQVITYTYSDERFEDIYSIRLVQKSWLREVTRLGHISRDLLFILNLDKTNSLNTCAYVRKNGQKILDHFVSTMTNPVDGIVPPFGVKITQDFFQHENHLSITNFLSGKCIDGLVELNMTVPKNGGSVPFIFPQHIILPNLKRIDLSFCKINNATTAKYAGNIANNYGLNSNVLPFIQCILNGSVKLSEFYLNCNKIGLYPTGTTDLVFPNTLKRLDLMWALNNIQLERLVTKAFPNLTWLGIGLTKVPLSDDMLFRILNNVKGTLRHFTVGCDRFENYLHIPDRVSTLRFPVMKCLETLYVNSIYVELGAHDLGLQKYLPELKEACLSVQTVARLRKWTKSSSFPNVSTLKLVWCDEESPDPYVFNFEEMKSVHGAFPNLSELGVDWDDISREAVQYLFAEMRQLNVLNIRLQKCNLVNSDHWDSLLIGVPTAAMSELRDNPALWRDEEFMANLCTGLVSIKNLTLLQTLELDSWRSRSNLSSEQALISDLVFDHALLQMPKLEEICMEGAFELCNQNV